MPGVREGWGLVVVEANAMGTPTVGYDIPGLRDSIRDGTNGVLVQPDFEMLASAATKLLGDKDELARLGQASRSYATGFTWEVTADVLLQLIKKLLPPAGAGLGLEASV
jgi:glycosyltransferase involved in cell wall biosynthesis